MSLNSSSVTPNPTLKRAWWKESSVYQIYPASFKDSNGDGIGDLKGIISQVDYIKKLGSDIVWLSPIFKSPQVDMGYDISDYYSIHEPYGTVEDVDTLAKELHSRGMKLVLDLVVNHTSDQHPWFVDARSSPTSAYRDWYIWGKSKFDAQGNRQPPNNWRSYFGGSAWEYDEPSGEYYLHLFAKEQPDLNWANPKVREEVHRIVRFWLDRGADGYRMDVINFISKHPDLPDIIKGDEHFNPETKYQNGSKYYACGPRLHEYLQDIGKILKEYDAFSVGEMPEVNDPHEIIKVVGADRGELSMIFNFEQ
jgi:glycosidase